MFLGITLLYPFKGTILEGMDKYIFELKIILNPGFSNAVPTKNGYGPWALEKVFEGKNEFR
jgi:hypothetical protein